MISRPPFERTASESDGNSPRIFWIKNLLKRYAFPFYRPIVHAPYVEPLYYQLKGFPTQKNKVWQLIYGSLAQKYDLIVLERIVEIPFVFQNLDTEKGATILDFGCSTSLIALQLASLGYNTVGVDLTFYPFSHPNLRFVQGDFLKNNFQPEQFDCAIAISTIEHCGLGVYGEPRLEAGDHKCVREIHRVLRTGGRFLMTVPYGRAGETPWFRVYDRASLGELLLPFEIVRSEYYVGLDRQAWCIASEEEINNVDSATWGHTRGVACVVARKR